MLSFIDAMQNTLTKDERQGSTAAWAIVSTLVILVGLAAGLFFGSKSKPSPEVAKEPADTTVVEVPERTIQEIVNDPALDIDDRYEEIRGVSFDEVIRSEGN